MRWWVRWVWPDLPIDRTRLPFRPRFGFVRVLKPRLLRQVCSAGVILGALLYVAIAQPGLWGLLVALLITPSLVMRTNTSMRQSITLVLLIGVVIATIDYLSWRFVMINWWSWWISVPLFAAEVFGAVHAVGLQYTIWPRQQPALAPTSDATLQPVFIFIPTVDEGPAILEPTLHGVLAARETYLRAYPHGSVTIVLCNDGRVAGKPGWPLVEQLADAMGVVCVTRTVGGGAKAGNIEHARQLVGATGDALVVIFDADQIAHEAFLLKTIPPFSDTRIGWVQTGQYYSNLENPVARWADDQQALFYQVLCPGKATLNSSFICGTNVVLRAAALDEIGGLPQDSVTEDFSASIELHPHWQSLFLSDVLATGLGPMDLMSYFKQQRRWAIGTLSVMRSHWRQIALPRRGGLGFGQRLQYAMACTHYLCGLRDLVYLVTPLLFLLTGVAAVRGATLADFLWHFLPYFVISQVAFWFTGWGRTTFRGIIIGFGSFPVLLDSLMTVILGRSVGFAVTSKQRASNQAWRQLRVHLVMALASIATLVFVFLRGPLAPAEIVSAIWVVYSLGLLGAMIWLGWRDQHAASEQPERLWPRQALARAASVVRRPVFRLAALGLVLLLASQMVFEAQASATFPFFPAREHTVPYVGVALPYDQINNSGALALETGTPFAIVGRTQDIGDRFDTAWANELAARNSRPWITLLFAVGAPNLESSLPAIANGLHDDELRSWAREIRNYGQPVYLSILPHVDRNWSISSAVANGGIPQDAPRAWAHVRALFQEEGASNAAFVWSPADPANDEHFAPPADQIDVVLLSLISYPNTAWADPAASLQAVAARYPEKPLLLEISAAGEPGQKAAWLHRVGDAIGQAANVHALIYHEGGPDSNASPAEQQAWSLASSPESLAAFQHIIESAALHAAVARQ